MIVHFYSEDLLLWFERPFIQVDYRAIKLKKSSLKTSKTLRMHQKKRARMVKIESDSFYFPIRSRSIDLISIIIFFSNSVKQMAKLKPFLKFSNDQMTHFLFVSDHESRWMHKIDNVGWIRKERFSLSEKRQRRDSSESKSINSKREKLNSKEKISRLVYRVFSKSFMVFITPKMPPNDVIIATLIKIFS